MVRQVCRSKSLRHIILVIVAIALISSIFVPVISAEHSTNIKPQTKNEIQIRVDDGENEIQRNNLKVGIEWIEKYCDEDNLPFVEDSTENFYNKLGSYGWNKHFNWGNDAAWEQDFKRSSEGGTENDYADDVDILMFGGHGYSLPRDGEIYNGLKFKNGVPDDQYLDTYPYEDVQDCYGDKDIEWLCLDACNNLGGPDDISDNYWARAMDGIHLITGFSEETKTLPGDGGAFAGAMHDSGWFDYSETVKNSWFVMQQHPWMGTKVIGENKKMGEDHLHGEPGITHPDPKDDWQFYYWHKDVDNKNLLHNFYMNEKSSKTDKKSIQIYKAKEIEDRKQVSRIGSSLRLNKKLLGLNSEKESLKNDDPDYFRMLGENGKKLTVNKYGDIRYTSNYFAKTVGDEKEISKVKNDLPTKEHARSISDNFLNEIGLIDEDISFITTGRIEQGEENKFTGKKYNDVITERTCVYGTQIDEYPIVDSFVEVNIDSKKRITNFQSDVREYETAGKIDLISKRRVLESLDKYGSRVTLGNGIEKDDIQSINSMSLGYYQGSSQKSGGLLMPVYIVNYNEENEKGETVDKIAKIPAVRGTLKGPIEYVYSSNPEVSEDLLKKKLAEKKNIDFVDEENKKRNCRCQKARKAPTEDDIMEKSIDKIAIAREQSYEKDLEEIIKLFKSRNTNKLDYRITNRTKKFMMN